MPNWSNQKKFLLSSKIIATIISLHCLWFVYKHRKYPGIGLQLAHLCSKPWCLADAREATREDNESMKQCLWIILPSGQVDLLCQHPTLKCIPNIHSKIQPTQGYLDHSSFDMHQQAQVQHFICTQLVDRSRHEDATTPSYPKVPTVASALGTSFWCFLCGQECASFTRLRTHIAKHCQGNFLSFFVFLFERKEGRGGRVLKWPIEVTVSFFSNFFLHTQEFVLKAFQRSNPIFGQKLFTSGRLSPTTTTWRSCKTITNAIWRKSKRSTKRSRKDIVANTRPRSRD